MTRVVVRTWTVAVLTVSLAASIAACGDGENEQGSGPVFAVGEISDGTLSREAVVLRSDDVGASWAIVSEQRFTFPTAIRFVSSTDGAALSGTSFFHTADGGRTWHLVGNASSLPPIDAVNGALVLDLERAVLFGERRHSTGNPFCSVYPTPAIDVTTDAGATWTAAEIGGGDGSAFASTTLNDGCAAGATGLLVRGWERISPPCALTAGLFVSRTLGATWEPAHQAGYDGATPQRIACTSEGGSWVLGAGSLWGSSDGGRSWANNSAAIPEGVSIDDGGISFIDQRTGWLVASAQDRQVLLATHDGALTWSVGALPEEVKEIVFFDREHGFGSGSAGHPPFQATNDGGHTWRPARVPAAITLVSEAQLVPRSR